MSTTRGGCVCSQAMRRPLHAVWRRVRGPSTARRYPPPPVPHRRRSTFKYRFIIRSIMCSARPIVQPGAPGGSLARARDCMLGAPMHAWYSHVILALSGTYRRSVAPTTARSLTAADRPKLGQLPLPPGVGAGAAARLWRHNRVPERVH